MLKRTTYLLLLFALFPVMEIFGQTVKNFDPPNEKKGYYYLGGKNYQHPHHLLTFRNDSTCHITVPNNSLSCWNWGEYAGRVEIKEDTVMIYLPVYERNGNDRVKTDMKEVFLRKGKTLYRLSPENFMFEKYKLVTYRTRKSE